MVFHTFLVQKAVSVDSFTKMDAKWPRARFGLGRAGWAGPGWLGWAGWLAGLAGWAAWAGLLGWLGWAGLGRDSAWDWFCRLLDQNLIKSSFLGLVFPISGANARKCLKRASWDSFCRLLEPRPESHQIKLPGTGFLDFWSQRQKVFKSSFLGFVLSTSGAKARKSSNRVSWDWFSRLLEPTPEIPSESIAGRAGWAGWLAGLAGWAAWAGLLGWLGWAGRCRDSAWDWFCRLLEPRPESHQIEPPGSGFLDFWSQRQEVFKSSFLGFVLSASGAKARKSSNQASWDRFS